MAATMSEGTFLDNKAAVLDRLLSAVAGESRVLAVAYSGGLDSRFLIHAALRADLIVRALHVRGPHIASHEHAFALSWAVSRSVPLTVIDLDPLDMPVLRNNPEDRCYHCKKAIFSALREAAGSLPLCDGTNASDMGEYRPGLRALLELGIQSPLAEAGISKPEIQRIAVATGLENPIQAAQPCLLTRFPYGTALTGEMLAFVGRAEDAVREVFFAYGFDNIPFRVRFENATTPALHLTSEPLALEVENALACTLKSLNFPGVPIRRVDSLSGYFDKKETGRLYNSRITG